MNILAAHRELRRTAREEHLARVSVVGCMRDRHTVRLQDAVNPACLEPAMIPPSLRSLDFCAERQRFRGACLAEYLGSVRCQSQKQRQRDETLSTGALGPGLTCSTPLARRRRFLGSSSSTRTRRSSLLHLAIGMVKPRCPCSRGPPRACIVQAVEKRRLGGGPLRGGMRCTHFA